jgi:CRP-like cAMP-binding protein
MREILVEETERLRMLRASNYFRRLSEPILTELARGTRLYQFTKGEAVFWEGERCQGLYCIRRGSVKLFKVSTQGRELIIKIFAEKDSFNEVPVFDGGPNPLNVAALEDCEIWIVGVEAIQACLEQHPEMARSLIVNLSQNLRMLVRMVEELSFYQVTNRLARLITQLPAEQLVGERGQRLTQDRLAARLGTVREVVARSLRELERSGAIQVRRGQIRVQDPQILREWTEGP